MWAKILQPIHCDKRDDKMLLIYLSWEYHTEGLLDNSEEDEKEKMCKEGRENKSLHEICFVRKVTGWALLQDPASKSLLIPVHQATDTQGWHNQGNVDPNDPKWVSLLPSGVFTGGSWCFPGSSAPVQALQTQHGQPKRQQKPSRKLWNVINFVP